MVVEAMARGQRATAGRQRPLAGRCDAMGTVKQMKPSNTGTTVPAATLPDNRKIDGLTGKTAMEPTERQYILDRIPDAGTVLEIGTLDGVTVAWWAKRKPKALFISVDAFIGGCGTGPGNAASWRANAGNNQRLITGNSATAMRMERAAFFHVCVVDADHSYKWTLADMVAAAFLCRDNGTVFVHDYGRTKDKHLAAVTTAVADFVDMFGWRIMGQCGTVVALKRGNPNAD